MDLVVSAGLGESRGGWRGLETHVFSLGGEAEGPRPEGPNSGAVRDALCAP